MQHGSQLTESTNISETVTCTSTINSATANLRHSTMANLQEVYLCDSNNDRQSAIAAETTVYTYVCIHPVSTDILTVTMNESSADILLALSICFAMFENSYATFYGNPLCAVLLLPVLSVILQMYNYRCLYSAQSFSIYILQHSEISHLWSLHQCFLGVGHTMSVVAKPDISIWPPKPEIITSSELRQITSKFQRQIRDFQWWRARYMISQMVAATIDYQKLQDCRPQCLYCHFRLSVMLQSLGVSLFALGLVKNPRFVVGIVIWRPHCHFCLSVIVTIISRHIIVKNSGIVVGISMLSVIVLVV